MKAVAICQRRMQQPFFTEKRMLQEKIKRKNRRALLVILGALAVTAVAAAVAILTGSSRMSLGDTLSSLLFRGTPAYERIVWQIRIPRVLAAIVAGAGLSLSGLMMQTTLNNPMASPSTLGVSNAAVFGANLSIIAFAGGFLSTGNNLANYTLGVNLYSTGLLSFLFSLLSILLILLLCRLRAFSPNVVVLAGIALGAVFTAATTILQFYATDVGLSAAVVWSFGDLGRATYATCALMLGALLLGGLFFLLTSWRYNALLSGEAAARSMGVRVELLRFLALLVASLITAVCVSVLGIIGFVGIICPHVAKRLLGEDHRFSIPMSAILGSLLLLVADTLSRSIGGGNALPVGAITSLFGAPFFIAIIFSGGRKEPC